MIIDEDVYLEHFGIKGMRWGIRRTPDQLNIADTDTETTKGVKSDFNKMSNGEFLRKYATTKHRYSRRVAKWGDPYARAVDKRGSRAVAGMTPSQAALAIYGGAVIGIILAAKTQQYFDSGKREAKKNKGTPLKQNASLKGKKSVSQLHKDVVKPINPNFGAPGTKMNCRRATIAYEMRRRGNDVKATPSKYATGQDTKGIRTVASFKKDEKFESVWGQKRVAEPSKFIRLNSAAKAEATFAALKKHPNGSRGEVSNSWIFGGGHSMAWEIVNNKPVIFDTQNGKQYNSPAQYTSFTQTVGEIAYTRLDNRPIDEEYARRWVTNV